MKQGRPSTPPDPPPAGLAETADTAALHRSGAVARMLRMPVATLRVWERRYGLTPPGPAPGGRRLYSADDVRRLALLRQLTELGHAIGSLAPLDMAQLQRVAATRARALTAVQGGAGAQAADPPPRVRAWRLAVIGSALGARLQRPGLLRRLGRPVTLLGPFDDAAQAAAALRGPDLDALLIHAPQLHAGWLAAFEAAAPALAGVPRALLYGYAADPVCEALATAGTALLREPQPDAAVAQWLRGLSGAMPAPRPVAGAAASPAGPLPPRRWDDAALADFAGRSSTVACECPRHVAELLVQLSRFETYSAECGHRNAADAGLHAHLRQAAAAARIRFEAALEQVALHEGLMLPPSCGPDDAAAAPDARRAAAPTAAGPRRRTRAGTGAPAADSHGSA